MATIEYQTYTAHAKQRAFHRAVRQYDNVLFNGGRGSGKTTAGAIQSILESMQYQPGSRGVIAAPDYPMLEDSTMAEFFRWLPRHLISDFHRQRKIVTLTNGTEIAFRSLSDPEKARGPNRAWAWMDEPRNLKTREAFDTLAAQLRPTRKLWMTTTPSGIFHWLYDLFIAHPLPKSAVVTVKTKENPYLPPEFEEGLRTQYTGAFAQQELDALWVSFEGRIFDNFDLAGNVSDSAEYNPAWEVYWGVDDGYAHGDGPGHANYHPRVVLLGQLTPLGGMNIFYEYVKTGVASYQETINEVLALPYKRPTAAYIDSSAAMFAGALWEKDIYTIPSTHLVAEGIKNLRRLICDGNNVRLLQIHPRCSNLIRELQTYRYDERSAVASVGEPKPLKVDDHTTDSLRYLCWPLHNPE